MGVHVEIVPLEKEHWPWVYEQTEALLCLDTQGLVALVDGELRCAVVFDTWTKNSCVGHFVFRDKRAIRSLIEAAFDFVFNFANRGILLGITPSDNEKALKFSKGLGFQELYRVKDGMDIGIDYVVQELRRENCKWLVSSEDKVA